MTFFKSLTLADQVAHSAARESASYSVRSTPADSRISKRAAAGRQRRRERPVSHQGGAPVHEDNARSIMSGVTDAVLMVTLRNLGGQCGERLPSSLH